MIKPFLTSLLLLSLFVAAEEPQPVASVRVILLGIAQDGGIPHIGCENEICRTQRHYVSSLAIVQNQSIYLIDATPDLREQHRDLVKKYPTVASKNLFNGIFLTHAHMGHYAGLLYLGKESISTKQTPVYCSAEMASYLRKNAPWSLLVVNRNIEIKTFESHRTIDLGFKIIPLPVPHRKEFTDTYGYLIQGRSKSLLYIPDIDSWEPVKDLLQLWLNKVDYALLDGTFYSGKELPGRDMTKVPHPTIQHSLEFFKSMPNFRAQIFFTHFNHTNPVLNAGSEEAKSVTNAGYNLAVDWQEFTL